ncbi:dynamin family protein [Planococcus lenghuensis]|uniref:GTPase n=1 Tax=Planococcus lenghuensis TaxID=2213202 RepID=A0A1Q2L0H4_9BACL|nr:dynamin family protein [Planococcus lenghuensis]AQQ53557.1 GTPase [Planococcus lenghuensis]
MKVQDREQLLTEIARLYAIFEQNSDTERMQKARLFADKLMKQQFIIGFAGHFSSGKSTMINALTGETLLPSSPIPTSANIVTVRRTEEDEAVVRMQENKAIRFSGEYDFQTLKKLARSGDVRQIEIGHADSVLPEGVTVMDTPGVDSTDDAHRLSTESALHVADMVFYVMDYNHVQSELNFTFTRQLQKYTELYLIVNQIDKHRNEELAFDDFRQSVQEAFTAWGVEPAGIYYTSLKQPDAEGNDFPEVQALVHNAMEGWEQEAVPRAELTLKKLKDEHTAYLEEDKQERLDTFAAVLTAEEWEQREEIRQQHQELQKQLAVSSFSDWQRAFEQKRSELLNNANVTPYEVREALTAYMESLQPGFKVGLLFSGSKTEQERTRRREQLDHQLNEAVAKAINPHIRSLMKEQLRSVRLLTDEATLAIEDMNYRVPFDVIEQTIPKSTGATGTTVLNVADKITESIRRWFMQRTDSWKNEQEQAFDQLLADPDENSAKERRFEEKVFAIRTLEEIDDQIALVKRSLNAAQPSEIVQAKRRLETWESELEKSGSQGEEFHPAMLKEQEQPEEQTQQPEQEQLAPVDEENVIRQSLAAAELIQDIRGFSETAQYLQRKAEGLQEREFTVALFGAFSAGKSSFANALLGERVLPVSPNPMTAAINRIRPVTGDTPHETADVHLKTEAMLAADVRRSFEALGQPFTTLEDAYTQAAGILEKQSEEQQVHRSFIAAFQKGYPEFNQQLGDSIRTDRSGFAAYVAEEERSCFVESIDFYFDAPFTRSGVTLVDTPGADSINARHTGVAFDYIKNADAVLFITYYNHAFARADREFLIQLGRVKDAFEMDKMFFIVNAIDLAANDTERQEVITYVRNELQRFGIRFPRLSGVSSLQALEDREASGMAAFELEFHHFLEDELKSVAVRVLHETVENTVSRLGALIRQTESNLSRKEERLQELRELEQQVRSRFRSSPAAPLIREGERELEELLRYVQQRVFYRFGDFFKEAYNPSLFAKRPPREALPAALAELTGMLVFDLQQELRATGLRLMKFAERRLLDRFREDTNRLKELDADFSFTPYEPETGNVPEPGTPFRQTDYSGANRLFRGTKDFFERNGKERVRQSLEEQFVPDTEKFLQDEQQHLRMWLEQWIDREAEGLRHHLLVQSLETIESERTLLNEQEKLDSWKQRYQLLQQERMIKQ